MSGKAFDENALATVRRAYARQMLSLVGANPAKAARLEEAFATVPREKFLGPSPWRIMRPSYRDLAISDPALIYQDVLVALAPERGVNNGSPSLHAHWLDAIELKEGERVAHIGAGTGYYTAIIAHIVGESGHVTAVEYDGDLAEAARRNLEGYRNVTLIEDDGAKWPREETDCVYVNFAVARPAAPWLEQLSSSGRLIFPLGVTRSQRARARGRLAAYGAAFLISRAPGKDAFIAKWAGQAFFVYAEGALGESEEEREALIAAFERGGVELVRSLRWKRPPSPAGSWLIRPDWSLSYEAA